MPFFLSPLCRQQLPVSSKETLIRSCCHRDFNRLLLFCHRRELPRRLVTEPYRRPHAHTHTVPWSRWRPEHVRWHRNRRRACCHGWRAVWTWRPVSWRAGKLVDHAVDQPKRECNDPGDHLESPFTYLCQRVRLTRGWRARRPAVSRGRAHRRWTSHRRTYRRGTTYGGIDWTACEQFDSRCAHQEYSNRQRVCEMSPSHKSLLHARGYGRTLSPCSNPSRPYCSPFGRNVTKTVHRCQS